MEQSQERADLQGPKTHLPDDPRDVEDPGFTDSEDTAVDVE